MIKRAMAAGLNSAGINVRDLRVASSGVNRFTTRDSRCVGGIHLRAASGDPQTLEIHFYDKAGLDISAADEKKIERLYFRQEFRRSFFDQMGEIIYPARALEYYTAGMLDSLGITDSRARVRIPEPREVRLKVVAEMGYGVASVMAPQVAAGWGIDLIALRPFLDAERTTAGDGGRRGGVRAGRRGRRDLPRRLRTAHRRGRRARADRVARRARPRRRHRAARDGRAVLRRRSPAAPWPCRCTRLAGRGADSRADGMPRRALRHVDALDVARRSHRTTSGSWATVRAATCSRRSWRPSTP